MHHYMFAHKMLPMTLFENRGLASVLFRENSDLFLMELWDDVGEFLAQGTEVEQVSPTGLTVIKKNRSDTHLMAVVRLPEPVGVTEAYYIAVVLGPLPTDSSPEERMNPEQLGLRYFTLEVASSPDVPLTIFGEWTEDSHMNFGVGPPPELDAFITHVWEHLKAG